jgi:hypothetical protein
VVGAPSYEAEVMSNATTIPVPAFPDATTRDGVGNPCDFPNCANAATGTARLSPVEVIDVCDEHAREFELSERILAQR